MRILLVEHVENAVQSLRSTRSRTLLTTLGVAIGVASITTILSLSGGVTSVVSRQVDELGGNLAVVRPQTESNSNTLSNPLADQTFSTSTLTEEDLQDIEDIPAIDAVAPLMVMKRTLKSADTTVTAGTIIATTPGFERISDLPIREGQFIDSVTARETAVIGPQLSIALFGTDQPVGKTFSIRDQTFTVIGVLKRQNNPVNYNNVDLDDAVIISLESGKNFHQGIAQLRQINIKAKSIAALPNVTKQIEKVLLENHNNEKDFSVVSGKEIARPTSELFTAITGVMIAIAAISLIVGGIGIMNIMLVSVAERTREIGLRKSVGATSGNIVGQFMIESSIISLLGGIIGYIGGYIVAFAISTFLPFAPSFSWYIAASTLGMSVVVGLVFGLYPAIRAARKDPIESLRQYH